MKLDEINAKYTSEELRQIPGNGELRFNALLPVLTNLYQNKVIYRQRFICIVSLRNIELSPEGFGATCTPVLPIEIKRTGDFQPKTPSGEWSFRGSWDLIGIRKNSIGSVWGGWTIWPENDLVEEAIRLASKGEVERVLALLDG